MTLKECTKQELIFIINKFKKYAFSQGDYYLSRCLHDVEYQRLIKRQEEADKQSEVAYQSRLAYLEFIKKYEGQKLTDIPEEEIKRANELLKTADRADKKYMQLTNEINKELNNG